MEKYLVVLNDGTDEIYNIHSVGPIHCVECAMFQLADLFGSFEMLDAIRDDPSTEVDNVPALLEELGIHTGGRQFILVETDNPNELLEKIDEQNAEGPISFEEDEFKPWVSIVAQLLGA